jgi:hypothetical protein
MFALASLKFFELLPGNNFAYALGAPTQLGTERGLCIVAST